VSKKTKLDITAGLPFKRVIVVTLPTGRNWWTVLTDFEVRMQCREAAAETAPLVFNFTPFLTVTFSGLDQVYITLVMTGADTRTLTEGGYFDVIMSDVGVTDARGYTIATGSVRRRVLVTKKDGTT